MRAYGIPCPAMVSPNAGLDNRGKLLYPDDSLIRHMQMQIQARANATEFGERK